MELTWSAFALSDRDAIFTYIETDNPAAAVLIDEPIAAGARRLVGSPASGRVGRIAGTRELVSLGNGGGGDIRRAIDSEFGQQAPPCFAASTSSSFGCSLQAL